jgi:hypothetical protein
MTEQGRCLCSAIQYSFSRDAVAGANHCHCRDCQRATGAGSTTFCMVPEAAMTQTGTTRSFTVQGASGGDVTRHFCGDCGSQLYSQVSVMPGFYFVKVASLEDSSWVQPQSAFWGDSAQPWAPPIAGVPVHAQNPG